MQSIHHSHSNACVPLPDRSLALVPSCVRMPVMKEYTSRGSIRQTVGPVVGKDGMWLRRESGLAGNLKVASSIPGSS